jgi:hypothetical protein
LRTAKGGSQWLVEGSFEEQSHKYMAFSKQTSQHAVPLLASPPALLA